MAQNRIFSVLSKNGQSKKLTKPSHKAGYLQPFGRLQKGETMSKKLQARHEHEIDLNEFHSLAIENNRYRAGTRVQSTKISVATTRARDGTRTATWNPSGPRSRWNFVHQGPKRLDPITALERSLESWGITEKSVSRTHIQFRQDCFDRLRQASTSKTTKEIVSVDLPNDPTGSIIQVLGQEIDLLGDREYKIIVEDLLPSNMCGSPYKWNFRQECWELRSEFTTIDRKMLDPFQRFVTIQRTKEEHFRSIWMCKTDSEYTSSTYRALIGHAVCNGKQACVSCGERTLAWNLSKKDRPNWTKICCSSCQSTYEIKTPKSSVTVQKRLSSGKIHGMQDYGDFTLLAKENPNSNHFVVMVGIDKAGPYPVWIANTVSVNPELKNRSFILDGDIRIYSCIEIGNARRWFYLPESTRNISESAHSSVLKMLDDKFSPSKDDTTSELNPTSSRQELQDILRELKRKRNQICQLRQMGKSQWSKEDQILVDQEEHICQKIKKVQNALW